MEKEKLIWTTQKRKISDLIGNPKNPRQISEVERKQLSESIEKFGLVEIPAINLDNKILAGHQRLKIMTILGKGNEVVDVRVPNRLLLQEEAEEYLIRSNKNSGSWDWEKLKIFDNDFLKNIGFTDEEMKMNFSLSDVEFEQVDLDRLKIIEILPPESPRLKERVAIHFDNIDDYLKFKEAVKEGKINQNVLIKII